MSVAEACGAVALERQEQVRNPPENQHQEALTALAELLLTFSACSGLLRTPGRSRSFNALFALQKHRNNPQIGCEGP